MSTTESGGPLELLARRLHRPVESLRACAVLSEAEQATLLAAVEHALAQRSLGVERSLARLIPWPLRAPLLRRMRR